MEGRPATIIRSDFCSPKVMRSKSVNPVASPVMGSLFRTGSRYGQPLCSATISTVRIRLRRGLPSPSRILSIPALSSRSVLLRPSVKCAIGDLGANPDQLAFDRIFPNDRGISGNICGAGSILCRAAEIGQPARLFQLPVAFQLSERVMTSYGWFCSCSPAIARKIS